MTSPVNKPISLSSPRGKARPLVRVGRDHLVEHRGQRVRAEGLEPHLLASAAGSPPPRSSSAASTALDCVAESWPPDSMATSAAKGPGSRRQPGVARRRHLVGGAGQRQRRRRPGSGRRRHQRVQPQVDHGSDLVHLGVARATHPARRPAGDAGPTASGRARPPPGPPRRVGRQRDQVGLGEVAVVVRLLLGAHRLGAPRRFVPVPRLLVDRATGLEHGDLPGAPRTRWPGRASAAS